MTITASSIEFRLDRWLRNNGWAVAGRGPLGEMWTLTNSDARLAVPTDFATDPTAFDGILERLAFWCHGDLKKIRSEIELWDVDVSEFVADINLDPTIGQATAPLHVVSHLFSGAGRVMRAAAQTSYGPKEVIENFGANGEASFRQVLAGMTREGSYVLPIYVPVGTPIDDSGSGIVVPTPRRSITATAARALAAIEKMIIERAKEPTREVVHELVQQGVSKELLTATRELLGNSEVDSKTKFIWAPSHAALTESAALPHEVIIPYEARDLLEMASKQFKPPAPDDEAMEGSIKGIMMGDERSVITIMNARRGDRTRLSTIHVTHPHVTDDRLDDFFRWMKANNKIFFSGQVFRKSNTLQLEAPPSFDAQEGLFEDGKPE